MRTDVPSRASELKNIDCIIVAAGYDKNTEKENSDRTYSLPKGQDELIQKALGTGKKVIVIIYSGGEVDITKWADKTDAIIMAWYTGQESGKALADIISGKASPSGRLPFTFWGSWDKNPTSASYHRQKLYATDKRISDYHKERFLAYDYTDYNEGVFVGYRGVEHFGIEPMFPFGFGLTYSSFEYSCLQVAKTADGGAEATFTVTNTGKRAAAEVAQVYVAPVNPSIIRPDHELKGYEKLFLAKGESRTVTVKLPASAFSYYDVASHNWKLDKCAYRILVGASASDIKLQGSIEL